jgi:hypothetical protein
MMPLIERLTDNLDERRLLIEMTKSYKTRIMIPTFKKAPIIPQVLQAYLKAQKERDHGAAIRVRRAFERAEMSFPAPGPV